MMWIKTTGRQRFQSTQPKRAATLEQARWTYGFRAISIHAAQEGCDGNPALAQWLGMEISIHAAQEGCDRHPKHIWLFGSDFNPRSPRGLRPR